MEAPGFTPLSTGPGSAPRTLEGFMRPVRAFLGDPSLLAGAADRDILTDIDAMAPAERLAFLTGLLPKSNPIYDRIKLRIDTARAKLQAMKPPVTLTVESGFRVFSEGTDVTKDKSSQARKVFEKFFLVGKELTEWDTFPAQFKKKGKPDRGAWLALPSKDRLDVIIQFSALPGTSRHHWGTEIDFNSVKVADWQPPNTAQPAGKFFALGQWLQANAPKVGFLQAYTPGRSGGYNEEPWHYSYAPLSFGLRQRYSNLVNLQTDVIDKIEDDFKKRAAAFGQKMPSDFKAALQQLNVSDLVNSVGPGL
jgi:hypothetical protein